MKFLTTLRNDPNISPAFRRALPERVPVATLPAPTTALEDMLDDTIASLVALRQSAIVREPHLDNLDPDHLTELAILDKHLTAIFDVPLYEIAMLGGIASRDTRSIYRFSVSDALDGGLDIELRDRAQKLREEPAIEGRG
jgi:hypothetical protein